MAGVLVSIDETAQCFAQVSSIANQRVVLRAVGEVVPVSAPDARGSGSGIQIGASTSRALIQVPFAIRDSKHPISQFFKEQTALSSATNRASRNGFQV